MSDDDNIIYRVLFYQDNKLYEIYSQYISEESLVGFLEVEELIFKDASTSVVVDPGEEKLRQEFKGVTRSYIPIHLVQRIDEVQKEGIGTIKEVKSPKSNVSQFPGMKMSKPVRGDDDD